jgi:hypothetical protein
MCVKQHSKGFIDFLAHAQREVPNVIFVCDCVQTAYFVVSDHIKHGEELFCSYFACRNAGTKFRYCSHCKVPVAKRNFRKRHKHAGKLIGVPKVADVMDDDDDDDDTEEDSVEDSNISAEEDYKKQYDKMTPSVVVATAKSSTKYKKSPAVAKPKKKEKSPKKGLPTTTAKKPAGPSITAQSMLETLLQRKVKQLQVSSDSSKCLPRHDPIPPEELEDALDERQMQWTSLLGKRPRSGHIESTASWVQEVLAVSDLDTPLLDDDDEDDDDEDNGDDDDEEEDESSSSQSLSRNHAADDDKSSSSDSFVLADLRKRKKSRGMR